MNRPMALCRRIQVGMLDVACVYAGHTWMHPDMKVYLTACVAYS